jgi:hypothetical protein
MVKFGELFPFYMFSFWDPKLNPLLLYNLTSSIGHATLAASYLFMPHKVFPEPMCIGLIGRV